MTGPSLQFSDFDSAIFGLPFYRVIVVGGAGLADELEAKKTTGRLIADAKIAAGDQEAAERLEGLGFRRVATQVELTAAAESGRAAEALLDIADHLDLDPTDLTEHAASFTFSRFMQDPQIPRDASVRFIEAWIRNSLAGRRKVVAIGRNFCTYRVCNAEIEIDLLSCLDRRRGFAAKLLTEVRAIAATAGVATVRVVTEAENVPALRTYLSSGFLPSRATLAYHLVYPPSEAA